MAGNRETEIARKAVTIINSGSEAHGVDAEEIMDTAIKIFFAQQHWNRLKFCGVTFSHAALNIVVEGWRKLSGVLHW